MGEHRNRPARDGDVVCFTIRGMRVLAGWEIEYEGWRLEPGDHVSITKKSVSGLLDSEVAYDLHECALFTFDIGTRDVFSPHELEGQEELPFD